MFGLSRRVFLLSIVSSSVYAGTIDPQINDKEYVEYANLFPTVGKICGIYNDGSRFCGSAVAIDDYHVLTAAHVIKNSVSCFFYINDKEYCIKDIRMHKDFEKENFGIADIAIGKSEKSFNLKKYPELYDQNDEIGKECSICGYGFNGTFKTGAKFHDNKKRAGLNRIDYIDEDMLVCSASERSDKNITAMEFLIASGDSGGGLFIDKKLAGINSCVMAIDRSPQSKYNEESGHTRVFKFLGWINEYRGK
jgi:secreted trypsin-like serine protease